MSGFNENDLRAVAQRIGEADAVLVGASNGLSITEGLHLFADDAAFQETFGDLRQARGLRCILHGMGYPWETSEELWGFWARLAARYCLSYEPTPVMRDLLALVSGKDYFVLTSNGECHFEMAGFAADRIYEVEGNWLTMQCSRPCHGGIYSSVEKLRQMAAAERGGRVPAGLVPLCPECGSPMRPRMEGAGFVEDRAQRQAFEGFLERAGGKKLVVLELGIGPRNRLVKPALMRLVAQEEHATYVSVNLGELFIPCEIAGKSFGFDGLIADVLAGVRKASGR